MIRYTDEDRLVHQSWCLRNDIKIYYKPTSMVSGVIVVDDKGKKSSSVDTYRMDNKPYRGKKFHKRLWSEDIMRMYTTKYLEYNVKKE